VATPADRDAPIGIFDSGVGGLTVARAVLDQLPAERIVYVGDTAHSPYGPLSIAEIRRHTLAIGDALMERGVKALVVACNSASAACLPDVRERYPVPVVEVVRPAVRRAVAATRSGRIGVIGTRATIASGAYQDSFAAAKDTEITAVACPRFVDFVERGMTSGRQVLGLAQGYLSRCSAPASTPWCSAARTTRCSPGWCRSSSDRRSRSSPAPTRRPRTWSGC
jgi:glutamate racemase